jgi:hypothetical protein
MNGLYDILLFLFVLGAVSQGFNELGFFGVDVPDAGVTLSDDNVREIHESSMNQSTNEFNWIEVIKSFMSVIGAGILAMFTIIPMVAGMMIAVGVDSTFAYGAAAILQAPVTFVTLFGLYEFWTGRAAA